MAMATALAHSTLPRFMRRSASSDRERDALIAALVAAFALTDDEADDLADAILDGRTAAWTAAFTEAAQAVGLTAAEIADATNPLPDDVERALRTAAEAAAAAIVATYADDLERAVERMVDAYYDDPANDGASAAEAKSAVGGDVGEWARARADWKSDQVAQWETAQGADDGTAQLIEDLLDGTYGPGEGIALSDIVVAVLPDFSSLDECADYAGEEFSLEDADEVLGLFPMHMGCIHECVVLVNGTDVGEGE